MSDPSRFLLKLSQQLFPDPQRRADFCDRLCNPQRFPPFAPTLVWTKPCPPDFAPPWQTWDPLPWQPTWVDRLVPPAQPGRHSLHDQGYFYCLDLSSVFAAAPLRHPEITQRFPQPVILDVCAAPGGKSMMAWRSLSPRQLYCNEVVGKRLGMLHGNLKRCGLFEATQVQLCHQDPQALAETLGQQIEVAIVDAPCSGQSLLAKGEKNPGCFHPAQINKNANRQKRILAHTVPLIKTGGYLAYMTCTYSLEENEKVLEWFVQRFPQFVPVEIPWLKDDQSPHSDRPCYRLFPLEGLGAGAFTVLLRCGELP